MLSPRTGGENLWMWVSDGMKGFILGLIGLSSGFTVASALFALIATIGVLNRLAQVTRSAKNIRWYEICYMAGGIIGNGVYLYQMPLPGGSLLGPGLGGLFIGIYTGCFIGALAEVVNIFPILFHRIRLRQGMKALIWSVAAGKSVGGMIHFFVK